MNTKILIVEDEFIVANALRLAVEKAGYIVTGIVTSVEEADDHRQNQKPDLVLLDIRLEGKSSGIDLARKLKDENIPSFIYRPIQARKYWKKQRLPSLMAFW